MYQTFYVGADEEISSVVDKLRKSQSLENYFILSGRSLVAQSVVNFKLLKRESEKLQKHIVIVTQDEQIIKMVERSGIEIKSSMEGMELNDNSEKQIEENNILLSNKDKKNRLGNVGSDNFYGENNINSQSEQGVEKDTTNEDYVEFVKKPAIKSRIKTPITRDLSDLKAMPVTQKRPKVANLGRNDDIVVEENNKNEKSEYDLKKSFEEFLDPEKERKFERVLSHERLASKTKIKEEKKEEKKSSGGGLLFTVALIIMIVVIGTFGYVYIPRAQVKVYLERQDKELSLTVEADTSKTDPDILNRTIPAVIIEKEDEAMFSYNSTGISESSGTKARGSLVIYNEYSSASMPLIATTRFENEDGKIFRLVKGVLVPGVTLVSGENKPGAIEVEVVADSAGGSYNIEADNFTIPGFKGGDKYDKVYAKSAKPMTGGGLSGDEIKMVSQKDIDLAKSETEVMLKEKIENSINSGLSEGQVLVSSSSELIITESLSLASVGDIKNTFDYQAKAKGKYIIISKNDIKEIVENLYKNSINSNFNIDIFDIKITYKDSQINFEEGKSKINISAEVSARPVFDENMFKKEIISMNEDEMRSLLSQYPYIKNMEVAVSPEFLSSKIPQLDSRVSIEVSDYSISK